MEKNNRNLSIILAAIGCITILELAAIHYGIDGKLFGIVIAALAGIAGWSAPQLKLK